MSGKARATRPIHPVIVTFDPAAILTPAARLRASRETLLASGRFRPENAAEVARDLSQPRDSGAFKRGKRALRSRGLVKGVGAHVMRDLPAPLASGV